MLSSFLQSLRRLIPQFNGTQRTCRLALLGCVAVVLAACDPVLERMYMDEGAGANLYTTDQAKQTALLNEYFKFICAQAGGSCDYVTLVQAGMNDIDQRCDGYLTWLDARRRDKEPFLAEMAAVQMAVHTVMTVTGSSPKSLDIATAAFGLAAISYTQWNSRLLISIEQSTVQEVVYNSQQQYREKIKTWPVPDWPTAVYLLRNYLRLCMPISIEANINTTTRLVQRGATQAAMKSLVVRSTTTTPTMGPVVRTRATFGADSATDVLKKFLYPNGINAARDPTANAAVVSYMRAHNITTTVTIFLNSSQYADDRSALVRDLNLK